MESTLSRRQLLALGTVSFLAPALRFYPSESVALAGRAAWTAALLALPLMLGYCYFLIRLLALRREGEGLAELTRRLGGGLGPVLLGLAALWTLLYAAFVLRSGADRLVGTVYPKASPGVFIEVMGLLSLLAALAGPRSLGRMARIVQPFLLGVLLLLLFVALARADMDKLLPLTGDDWLRVPQGALAAADVLVCPAAGICFLAGGVKKRPGGFWPLGLWMGMLCLLLTLLNLALLGSFGAELAAALSRPFFVLVRTLVFFSTVERVEALVVMLWIFPDFLMAALYLWAGRQALGLLLEGRKLGPWRIPAAGDTTRGLTWVCGAAVIALGLWLGPDSRSLERWSTTLIPAMNLVFCFGLLPFLYILGSRRGEKET